MPVFIYSLSRKSHNTHADSSLHHFNLKFAPIEWYNGRGELQTEIWWSLHVFTRRFSFKFNYCHRTTRTSHGKWWRFFISKQCSSGGVVARQTDHYRFKEIYYPRMFTGLSTTNGGNENIAPHPPPPAPPFYAIIESPVSDRSQGVQQQWLVSKNNDRITTSIEVNRCCGVWYLMPLGPIQLKDRSLSQRLGLSNK